MIFILSDQNIPPVVHCEKGLNCPKVLRIENGTIGELVRLFVETVPVGRVPPVSVIACSSATHLADVGVAAYAKDFVEESRKNFGK
jgi:hypothetical protein